MSSLCPFDISNGVGSIAIGLSQVSSFFLHIGIHVRRTDTLHVISPLILGSTQDRRAHYASCNPQIGIYARRTNGQTTFPFASHIGIQVKQTDKLHNISSLILESTFDFTPHMVVLDRKTDKLCLISLLMLRS